MNTNNKIHIADFKDPKGVKGLLRIISYTKNFRYFNKKGCLIYENKQINSILKIIEEKKNIFIVQLKDILDRKEADFFKNKKIYVDRKNFINQKMNKNEFYAVDLLNCSVKDHKNIVLGKVKSVENFGAGELLNIIKKNKKSFLIPFNKDNISYVDLLKKKVVVTPLSGLLD